MLGWAGWRALVAEHGQRLTEDLLRAGMESGDLVQQPVRPLAAMLLGALNEGVLLVAAAENPEAARTEVQAILGRLRSGLRA